VKSENAPTPPIHSWREILVEYSLDAVVGINSQSLIIDWNLQAEKIFGWKREEAIGKSVSTILIPPEFREAHHLGIQRFMKTGVGPILNKRTELVAMHSSGNRFSIELSVSPIHTGNEILFYSFVRDITERKRVEEALKESLREKDEFISICSHELKTPITSMKLQFQLAQRMLDDKNSLVYQKENISKRIGMTLKQIEKMSKLIEDMLDVVKIPLGKLEQDKKPLEINEFIEEIFAHFVEQFQVLGIQTSFKKLDHEVYVLGDTYRLEQALSNLITNAVKYGDGKPIHVVLESSKDEVSLSVIDEGKGIAPEDLGKIFMRYTRLESKNSASGLGLGLYITKNIIEGHGGKITVESKLGHGSKFMIKLPRHIV
jgi:PAS domain S-box-containing protein